MACVIICCWCWRWWLSDCRIWLHWHHHHWWRSRNSSRWRKVTINMMLMMKKIVVGIVSSEVIIIVRRRSSSTIPVVHALLLLLHKTVIIIICIIISLGTCTHNPTLATHSSLSNIIKDHILQHGFIPRLIFIIVWNIKFWTLCLLDFALVHMHIKPNSMTWYTTP